MPKYTFKLTAKETFDTNIKVEADSLDQAEEMVKAQTERLDPVHDDFDYLTTEWEWEVLSRVGLPKFGWVINKELDNDR